MPLHGGELPPKPSESPPLNRTKEKVKGEKFASSLRNPRKLEKMGKIQFSIESFLWKTEKFSQESYILFDILPTRAKFCR